MQVEFRRALEDLEQALHLNPALAVAHYNWATITYRLGDTSASLPAFLAAVSLEPGNGEFREAARQAGAERQ